MLYINKLSFLSFISNPCLFSSRLEKIFVKKNYEIKEKKEKKKKIKTRGKRKGEKDGGVGVAIRLDFFPNTLKGEMPRCNARDICLIPLLFR